jgi:hypothetical protein
MSEFKVGDRVRVRKHYDEWPALAGRTGVVTSVWDTSLFVEGDGEDYIGRMHADDLRLIEQDDDTWPERPEGETQARYVRESDEPTYTVAEIERARDMIQYPWKLSVEERNALFGYVLKGLYGG